MLIPHEPENPLSIQGTYSCPVCHCGQLSNITLTEALGCNVCRHIFTMFPDQNLLKMIDREPPLLWRWTGQTWRGEHLGTQELTWVYRVAAFCLVAFPTFIVGFSALLFPPIPGSRWVWFPFLWTGIVFFCHLILVLWLWAEAYQFPVWLYLRSRWQRNMALRAREQATGNREQRN